MDGFAIAQKARGPCKERNIAMPMIDVNASAGTFSNKDTLLKIANAIMRCERAEEDLREAI